MSAEAGVHDGRAQWRLSAVLTLETQCQLINQKEGRDEDAIRTVGGKNNARQEAYEFIGISMIMLTKHMDLQCF